MITSQEADAQGRALLAAARHSPVAQLADPLHRQGAEWIRAAGDLTDALGQGLDAQLVFASTVAPGMTVIVGSRDGSVIRVLDQGGRVSLHVQDEHDGREQYLNLFGGRQAPVVIVRQTPRAEATSHAAELVARPPAEPYVSDVVSLGSK